MYLKQKIIDNYLVWKYFNHNIQQSQTCIHRICSNKKFQQTLETSLHYSIHLLETRITRNQLPQQNNPAAKQSHHRAHRQTLFPSTYSCDSSSLNLIPARCFHALPTKKKSLHDMICGVCNTYLKFDFGFNLLSRSRELLFVQFMHELCEIIICMSYNGNGREFIYRLIQREWIDFWQHK